VPETISDTGPILHLHEIGRLRTLATVSPLVFPSRVWEELRHRGLDEATFQSSDLLFKLSPAIQNLASSPETLRLQPADTEVFLLARERNFEPLVLTDDLALRRLLESRGAIVAGSVGILIRAYAVGALSREELKRSSEALLEESSLHLSRAFRAYVRKLVGDLP
jgi:predicted nucleic acid-binding protein